MSRSVKDLRELINISRLSFHGEDEHYESDERMQMVEKNLLQNGGNSLFYQDEKLSSRLDSSEGIEKAKTDLRNVRFKPLPAINSSKQTKQSVKRKEEIHLAYQRSCNNILEQLDECVVSAWLNRANECIQWLSKCVSTPDFFVRFAKFWLSEMNEQKRTELVEMEVEIIMDEIAFSVRGGLKSQTVCQKDVMSFFLLVIWEYPSKLCGSESGVFILNTFLTLSSSRKERYRGLLSNVKFATKSPEQVHWILSIRAFALISIVTALVRFYTSLGGLPIPNLGPADGSTQSFKTIDSLGFDAVRLGYLNVLMYLVDQQCLEVSEIKGKEESSFLFCAVTHCQDKIVKYILNMDKDVDMKQVSKSGNGLLHAAVNTGSTDIVRLLLEAGADVNQKNVECDDVMPLHLAIMQDYPEIVQILLEFGAEVNITSNDSPLLLAKELERLHIVDIIKKHAST